MALDNYSSDCFINEKLLADLNIIGEKTHIYLTTMEKTKSKQATKVLNNLDICDLDENEREVIPTVYTRSNWPFTKKDSPRPEDVTEFPYLHDIPVQYVD